VPPWPPCSTNTTPEICGLSRGGEEDEPAVVAQIFFGLALRRFAAFE